MSHKNIHVTQTYAHITIQASDVEEHLSYRKEFEQSPEFYEMMQKYYADNKDLVDKRLGY